MELHHLQKDPFLVLINNNKISRDVWKFITDKNLTNNARAHSFDEMWFDYKKNDGFKLNKNNFLRFIRVRGNTEVPDYVYHIDCENDLKNVSGVFSFNDKVFWSIASRPYDRAYINAYNNISKVANPGRDYKLTDMIEICPIHLNPDDDLYEWIYLVHSLRKTAHQYKYTLRMPLPLHLAKKLEEYVN